MNMKKIKNRFKKMDRQVLMFWVIAVILAIASIFICVQNMTLKNRVSEAEGQCEIKIGEGINDFTRMIIEKIDTCLPVQIVSTDKSAIVLGSQCLEKIE